mgnify:CR=1 FL=1
MYNLESDLFNMLVVRIRSNLETKRVKVSEQATLAELVKETAAAFKINDDISISKLTLSWELGGQRPLETDSSSLKELGIENGALLFHRGTWVRNKVTTPYVDSNGNFCGAGHETVTIQLEGESEEGNANNTAALEKSGESAKAGAGADRNKEKKGTPQNPQNSQKEKEKKGLSLVDPPSPSKEEEKDKETPKTINKTDMQKADPNMDDFPWEQWMQDESDNNTNTNTNFANTNTNTNSNSNTDIGAYQAEAEADGDGHKNQNQNQMMHPDSPGVRAPDQGRRERLIGSDDDDDFPVRGSGVHVGEHGPMFEDTLSQDMFLR